MKFRTMLPALRVATALLALACGTTSQPAADAGVPDAGGSDAGGRDAGRCDSTTGCTTDRVCGSAADCEDTDPCTRNESCDPVTATCTYTLLDNDEDGEVPLVCGGTDCDDSKADVGATAPEICGNDRDDNCNSVVDTDATLASSPLVLLNSEAHCGTCGNACAEGQSCYLGECVTCGGTGATCCDTTCTSTSACSGGSCTNGGACRVVGAAATCAAPGAPCGGLDEPCCAGGLCDALLGCVGGTCSGSVAPSCGDAGAPVLYRLATFDIPTLAQASNGEVVGHNLDNAADVCAVPDFTGGVDNELIDLAPALPAVSGGAVNLQTEIDHALACPPSTPSCQRLDLVLSIAVGTQCAVVELLDGSDSSAESLAGPVYASLGGSGNLRAQFPSLALSIPYRVTGGAVDLNFRLASSVLTANVSPTALTNVVLSGVAVRDELEMTFMNFVPLLDGALEYSSVSAILANLYDIQIGGMCQGLSMGFLASGTAIQ